MPFTEAEKQKWREDRKNRDHFDDYLPSETCSHCGIALPYRQSNSDFLLCAACDGD